MPVSKYWVRVDEFSASDAAFLILGLEPDVTVPSVSSHRHLLQRMHRAFLETCAHVRFCVEKDLDAYEVWSGVWQLEGEAELRLLASVEMLAVLNQVNSAQSRRSLALYRDLALAWLDGALDQFERQRFSRESLAAWLYWSEVDSEFDFGALDVVTPEQRREQVRRLVEDCNGNKSEVARRLGISRTRVDQLLSGPKAASNPLRKEATGPVANDPFSLRKK